MTINIKNVLSIKCKIAVEGSAETGILKPAIIEMGEAEIKHLFSPGQMETLISVLSAAATLQAGLPSAIHQKKELANKIKRAVIEIIDTNDTKHPRIKFSHIISKKLNYSYNYLTTVFAEVKGITIENFIILDKLERAKEMILSGSLTFTQIAVHLQYSSVSHLSSQFKRIIGLTPTEFRKSKLKEKMPKKRS